MNSQVFNRQIREESHYFFCLQTREAEPVFLEGIRGGDLRSPYYLLHIILHQPQLLVQNMPAPVYERLNVEMDLYCS